MSPQSPHPTPNHPVPSELAARLERELLPLVEHGPTASLVRQAITALQASPAPSHGDHEPLPITAHLVAQLQERAQRGLSKYGTTLDRDDLTTADWLLHAIEERLDDVGYMEAARRRALRDQARIAELEASLAALRASLSRSSDSTAPIAWLHPDDPSLAMSQVTKQRMLEGGSASSQAAQAFSQPAFGSEPSWRPIADAPRDGTEVWAFNGEQARMKWIEGQGYALWIWSDPLLSDADPSPRQPSHFVHLLADPVVG